MCVCVCVISDHWAMDNTSIFLSGVLRQLLSSESLDCEVSITEIYHQQGRKRCRSYGIRRERHLENYLNDYSEVSARTSTNRQHFRIGRQTCRCMHKEAGTYARARFKKVLLKSHRRTVWFPSLFQLCSQVLQCPTTSSQGSRLLGIMAVKGLSFKN